MNDTSPFSPVGVLPANSVAVDVSALAPWSQNLHLPDGTQTAPELGDLPQNRWAQICDYLPDDLSGCTALDVGCNAGFYAIELARRGATVTAVDSDPHVLRQAQWAIARHGLQDRITLYQNHAYDLARWRRRHDVVLFLELFDRLRYPLLALDIAARLVKRCLVFQGRLGPGDEVALRPGAIPFEATMGTGSSGVEIRSRTGIEAMLHSAGLEIAERPGADLYMCQARTVGAPELRRREEELDAATGSGTHGFTPFERRSAPVPLRADPPAAAPVKPAA